MTPFSEDPKIIVLWFACVAFGLSSSPFLLNSTLKHHILKYECEDPDFVQRLLQSLYIDDIITGDGDDEGAYQLYVKTKSRLAEGEETCFQFQEFDVQDQGEWEIARKELPRYPDHLSRGEFWNSSGRNESYTKGATHRPDTLSATEKVLGLQWNKEEDEIVLDLKGVAEDLSLEELIQTKFMTLWVL